MQLIQIQNYIFQHSEVQYQKKLREIGVEPSHTTTFVTKMRAFYDEIYAVSHGIEAAGGVM